MESVITQFNFTILKRGDYATLKTDSCIHSGRFVLICNHGALHLQTHGIKSTHRQLAVIVQYNFGEVRADSVFSRFMSPRAF